MRNLKKHPLTVTEITRILELAAEELERCEPQKRAYGDLRPLAFRRAAQMLTRVEFVLHNTGQ